MAGVSAIARQTESMGRSITSLLMNFSFIPNLEPAILQTVVT
jgi:hypothetical protein